MLKHLNLCGNLFGNAGAQVPSSGDIGHLAIFSGHYEHLAECFAWPPSENKALAGALQQKFMLEFLDVRATGLGDRSMEALLRKCFL